MKVKLVAALPKPFTQRWRHVYVIPVLIFPGTLNSLGHSYFSPKVSPSSVSSIRIPDGSHSCDIDASICIFRAEQESSVSAGFMLHMPRGRRHLGLLLEDRDASTKSVLHSR
jgi:hypothetical protein